jgi:CRP-like cAMP-binding protein
MTIDVEKLRVKARKLLSKRKVSQTLKLYETNLSKDPVHPNLWCELGSLQKSVGDTANSGASYFKAAEIWTKSGQDRHALAACQKAVNSGANIDGARRLLKVLAAKIKEGPRTSSPETGSTSQAAKATTPSGSLVSQAASNSRVQLGRSLPMEDQDYDELDVTPLPKPLSLLVPIRRRQASDFGREPTTDLDLDDYAESASGPHVFAGTKATVGAASPPPPVSHWDELGPDGKRKKKSKPAPQPARPSAAPAETFMVLSRRDPSMLLSGLRSGITYGISDSELAKVDAAASSPDHYTQEVLNRSLLFEGLSATLMATHAPPERRRMVLVDETVARSGSGQDFLFSILSGEVRVLSLDQDPPLEVACLGPGAVIGEQSFVGTLGMKSTVEVTREAEVQVLDRTQAEELLTDHPASLYAMLRVVEERALDNMLRRTGFFRLFERQERDEICHRFEILEVADDEVIVEQGTPSKTLCLLMSGLLEMSHTNADGRTVKMLLDPGGGFGMESLIDGRPATFTARTTARSWILLLRREEYLKVYEKHPNLVRALKDVARRRRKTLAAVNRGELELADASWPDFDPQMRNARVKKVRKDRSHSKNRSSGDKSPSGTL